MTLLETTLGLSLLGIVVASTALIMDQTFSALRSEETLSRLEGDGRRTTDRLAAILLDADASTVFPQGVSAPASTTAIEFQRGLAIVAGELDRGPVERIMVQDSPGDPDDGIDNDGNGLVDEKRIVWIQDPGGPAERTTVLTRSVPEDMDGEVAGNGMDDNGNGLIDEGGFALEIEGRRVRMHLTVERRDRDGRSVVRTFRRTVALRNGEP